MKLSDHFTLTEFTASDPAARLRIDHAPSAAHLKNLKATAGRMEEVRRLLGGKPIRVNPAPMSCSAFPDDLVLKLRAVAPQLHRFPKNLTTANGKREAESPGEAAPPPSRRTNVHSSSS